MSRELSYVVGEVRLKKSKDEKYKAKCAYRKEYASRPAVKEKAKLRLLDPDVIAKRKTYAERKDVKERKKVLSARGRAIRNALKYEHKALYEELIKRIEDEKNHENGVNG